MRNFIQRIVLFTIIITGLVITFETICHVVPIPKISHHNIVAKSQLLIPEIDSNSIIILGDSRLEWGLKTQAITNKNGKVLNLAFPGSNGFDIIQYLINKNIYPKTIIIGFTPNYYSKRNHNLDKIQISKMNLFKESYKYWLKQNSYTYDLSSVKLFLKGKHPYFINHTYDKYGNVIVKENGNFNERFQLQLEVYKGLNIRFEKNKFDQYLFKLNDLISKLEGKTNVYGLYMPVSDSIFSLEKENFDKHKIGVLFDYFMDFSDLISNNDSTYFYDGSHLNSDYAYSFTKKVNQDIKKQERRIKINK